VCALLLHAVRQFAGVPDAQLLSAPCREPGAARRVPRHVGSGQRQLRRRVGDPLSERTVPGTGRPGQGLRGAIDRQVASGCGGPFPDAPGGGRGRTVRAASGRLDRGRAFRQSFALSGAR